MYNLDDKAIKQIPPMVIFGATGYIGRHLLEDFRIKNPRTLGISRKPSKDLPGLDLSRPDITPLRLGSCNITHAIISSAVTGIGTCEKDPAKTRAVNVEGTLELARQLHGEGIKVITFSSDYVFDGITGNYIESSPVNPLNEYGRQKAEMEARLPEICTGNYLIVRLSKVFDLKKGSSTLLDEIAEKLSRGDVLTAAKDQIFCPTHIDDVVNILRLIIESGVCGLINACSPEKVSRVALVRRIAETMEINPDLIKEISLSELGETFTRPRDTSMVSMRIKGFTDYNFRVLQGCIDEISLKYTKHIHEKAI